MAAAEGVILREPRPEAKLPERPANSHVGVLDVFRFAAEADVVPTYDVRGYGPNVEGVRELLADRISDDALIAGNVDARSDGKTCSGNLGHLQAERLGGKRLGQARNHRSLWKVLMEPPERALHVNQPDRRKYMGHIKNAGNKVALRIDVSYGDGIRKP